MNFPLVCQDDQVLFLLFLAAIIIKKKAPVAV